MADAPASHNRVVKDDGDGDEAAHPGKAPSHQGHERAYRALTTQFADRKLGHDQRNASEEQEEDPRYQERVSAVGGDNAWEPPDIASAHRKTEHRKDKSPARGKLLSTCYSKCSLASSRY